MKYFLFIIIGLIAVFLAYLFFGAYRDVKQIDQATDTEQVVENQRQAKTDEQGEVSITITPQALGGDVSRWRFDVVFSTHSVSLDQDPVQSTMLVDDKGNEYKPTAWEGAESGDHHREGALVFDAIMPAPRSVKIIIKDVGGVSERFFNWDLK